MPPFISRRQALATAGAAALVAALPRVASAAKNDPKTEAAIEKGLKWVAKTQSSLGHWTAGGYPTAMTALAGTALIGQRLDDHARPVQPRTSARRSTICSASCGPTASSAIRPSDNRYTYGHGFSMLFLSQVLGEEEDEERREELIEALTKACDFSGKAQTPAGGWGYVSAKDGNNFDEGSTTITQVQGLRGCRNGGVVVPGEIIDRAKEYIYGCKNADGGISYSSRNRGSSRPAITAAALAALYNAGDYDSKHVPEMLEYCKKNLQNLSEGPNSFGHWHYTYLYYSQVMYRQGNKEWEPFRDKLYGHIVKDQQADGSWTGNIGPIYVTACNLIMLQLDRAYLPIYQR